jgi:flagellar protein FlaH
VDEIVKDGFDFGLETDSLSDSMGASLPNRSLCLITGLAGSGKSLVSQRLTFGLLMNGSKVVAVTTELTTRGWIEQMNSLGYFVADYIAKGRLVVISRFGTIAEPIPGIGLNDVLDSEVMAEADFIIIDSASSIMEMEIPADESFATLQKLRKFSSSGHSLLLTLDPTGTNAGLLQDLRSSAEVVLDMSATLIGGTLKRDLQVTRFLRAAGPVQTNVSWRVEPGMGFIVDITAVS